MPETHVEKDRLRAVQDVCLLQRNSMKQLSSTQTALGRKTQRFLDQHRAIHIYSTSKTKLLSYFPHFKHLKLPVFAAMKEYMAKVSMLEDDENRVPFQCGDQNLRRLLDGVEACHLLRRWLMVNAAPTN